MRGMGEERERERKARSIDKISFFKLRKLSVNLRVTSLRLGIASIGKVSFYNVFPFR